MDEDNFTLIEGNTFTCTRAHNVKPYAFGIQYCYSAGSAEIKNNTFTNLYSVAVQTHALTLPPDDHLLIEGNTIVDNHYDAISVEVWDRALVDFDNGPVIIRNNRIGLASELISFNAVAIDLGFWYVEGISNVVVEGNTFSGWATIGVISAFYGSNHKILNNDFSGLTTWQGAVGTMGRDGLIAGNIIGPSDKAFAAQFGLPWIATGILIVSQNPNPGVWPDTLPVTGNVMTGNDFRLTGLASWGYDAAGDLLTPGCVMLLSSADVGWNDPWPGAEVTDNLVNETGRFPRGTGGPKQQVLEFPTHAHDNQIVGHAANEYAQLEAENPGIRQKIKDAGVKFMEMLSEKQAFIKQLREEAEEH